MTYLDKPGEGNVKSDPELAEIENPGIRRMPKESDWSNTSVFVTGDRS
jgi:hypothetical protein